MPAKKISDIVATVGTYESQGATKKRYVTIGSLMQSDDGRHFILMARTFNPAGVPVKDGSDQILLSCFEPKEGERQAATQPKPARQQRADYDDDIAF